MKLKVITLDNKEAGEISLDKEIFGVEVRKSILHRVVNWQLAKRQAGTHKTKERSEVSGTTAKAYRQKGTGRARHGALRVVQMRGGGIAFGPRVRSHAHQLPKKIRKLGLKIALSLKQSEGKLYILKDINIAANKTGPLQKQLEALGFTSALIIAGAEINNNFKQAANNIKKLDVLPTVGANVYDILRRDKLVLTEDAVKALQERLA
jgi:large subunit ribosomal protein L4